MSDTCWKKIKRAKNEGAQQSAPIIVLAPMADVTDSAFRRVIAKYSRMGQAGGGPDVMWTEFVSCDGLVRAPEEGRAKLMRDLVFTEAERPIIAQFFTAKPDMMRQAAKLAAELGFDGVDINMGCPDSGVEKQGAGAALMKNPVLAKEIILAAKQGVEEGGKPGLPVSVKTRIGYTRNDLAAWIPALLETNPAVITVHCRTRKEMSLVPARWEHVKEAVEIRDQMQAGLAPEDRTLIFGNGDIKDLADAHAKAKETGADGVMLGRAIFGNPWLFDSEKGAVSPKEKLEVMVEHSKLFQTLLGDVKNFAIMKKHYKAYVNGWDGAKEFRMKLMETQNAGEVEALVGEYVQNLKAM